MERRHELPTHLGVEDHILGNLSMRQLLLLLSGLAAAYAAWTQLPALPLAVRATLAAIWALPMPLAGLKLVHALAVATGAPDAFGPAVRNQVGAAGVLMRESGFPLA